MLRRVLTYDLKNGSSYDYQELYDYLKEIGAKQLTESSYYIETSTDWSSFESKIYSITKSGDNVKAVVKTKDGLEVWTIR